MEVVCEACGIDLEDLTEETSITGRTRMRTALRALADDEELSDEGRAQRAQRVIENNVDKIRELYTDARAKAEAGAERDWKFSIPMPDKKTLAQTHVSDSGEMVAVQGEAERIATSVYGKSLQEATREASKNPRDRGIQEAPGKDIEALQWEFRQAMAIGGVEGKIRALAVKRVADGRGIPLDTIVDEFRTDNNRKALRDAEALDRARHMIPSANTVRDGNPFEGGQQRRNKVGTYRSTSTAAIPRSGPLFPAKKRRPSWK
jgi:hypothetical protein